MICVGHQGSDPYLTQLHDDSDEKNIIAENESFRHLYKCSMYSYEMVIFSTKTQMSYSNAIRTRIATGVLKSWLSPINELQFCTNPHVVTLMLHLF